MFWFSVFFFYQLKKERGHAEKLKLENFELLNGDGFNL